MVSHNCTPFSFLFGFIYLVLFSLLFVFSSFYLFWVLIELLMFVLIGIAYSMVVSSYSSLMLYFLIQTYSSFSILLAYSLDSIYSLMLFVFLKLGIFPFHFWFPVVCYRLPNLLLWLVSTVHNFPIFLGLYLYSIEAASVNISFLSVCFTLVIIGFISVSVSDIRFFLIVSSALNNAWFMMAWFAGFNVFITYIFLYAIFFGCILFFSGLSLRFMHSSVNYNSTFYIFIVILILSGIPPFPMFFIKCIVIYSILLSGMPLILVISALLFSVMVLIAYLAFTFNYFVLKYLSVW